MQGFRKVQRNYKKYKAVNHIGQMHRVIGVVLPFLLVSKREERVKNKFFTLQVCVCVATQTLRYAHQAAQK